MNDFTKEELRCLANSIRVTLGHEPVSECHYEFHCALRIKIQSMIDDYCEHDYRCSNEAHFKCKDCGDRER